MPNRLTDEQLDTIRKRAEAATEGVWEVVEEIDGVYSGMNTVVRTTKPSNKWASRIVSVGQTRRHVKDEAEANAIFIANARQDIPTLLDEIEQLRNNFRAVEVMTSCEDTKDFAKRALLGDASIEI